MKKLVVEVENLKVDGISFMKIGKMKPVVYYSLTQRGFYSEVMNLILAKIYCDKNDIKLIVNTRNWNSRYKKGWEDYFKPDFDTTNDLISSQYYVDGFGHKLAVGNFLKKPCIELGHLGRCLLNYYFRLTTRGGLSEDIFFKMRNDLFLGSLKDCRLEIESALIDTYVYNDQLKAEILENKKAIGIYGKSYISVHVRRGDKIATKEMEYIEIEQYLAAIKAKGYLSKIVYIATDDISVVEEIRLGLGEYYSIFYNTLVSSVGFDADKHNKESRENRYCEAKLAILDVDILLNSEYFIGTYSSNLSRIIPCFKGLDACESLDIPWAPVF